jgi:hypothetical protein
VTGRASGDENALPLSVSSEILSSESAESDFEGNFAPTFSLLLGEVATGDKEVPLPLDALLLMRSLRNLWREGG